MHAHKHTLRQPLGLILITWIHHGFFEVPRVIKGGEMTYIPVLV